jgi:ASC-1-like (ASCH) protein
MSHRDRYVKKASYLMESPYEIDPDGDIMEETTRAAVVEVLESDPFKNMLKDYIFKNEYAPDEQSAEICVKYYEDALLKELKRTITGWVFNNLR